MVELKRRRGDSLDSGNYCYLCCGVWYKRHSRLTTKLSALLWFLTVFVTSVLLVAGVPSQISFISIPELKRLRFNDGMRILPKFAALSLAIIMFGTASIAEIVRGSFNTVGRGQLESARS